MPRDTPRAHPQNLANRRQRNTPAPLRVSQGKRPVGMVPHRPRMEPVRDEVSPLSPRDIFKSMDIMNSGGSGYTFEYNVSQQPQPLYLESEAQREDSSQSSYSTHGIQDGHGKANSFGAVPNQDTPAIVHTYRPRKSKSTGEGLRREPVGGSPPKQRVRQSVLLQEMGDSPLFSPFPFYFRGQDYPAEKKGEKILIGEKGWLERTDKLEAERKGSPKKMGFLDGIKKIAKDMTELHYPSRRPQQVLKENVGTQMAISLDAREQSLLYGELEFHLTNSLNAYINVQLEKGRLMTDKLKRIGDAWIQQGRPRVVGFRYDLETQLELVHLHVDDFVFYGRRQGNPIEIAGLLHAMKVNARAMRVRTFCQPDSVIAKQLVDAQSLFNMVGVAKAEDQALAEIAQFFKVCIEREQKSHQQAQYRARKERMEYRSRREQAENDGDGSVASGPAPQGSDDEWLYYPN